MKKAKNCLFLALTAAILCLALSCSISEDNGKPVDPGNSTGSSSPQVVDSLGQLTVTITPQKDRIGIGESAVIEFWTGYVKNGVSTGVSRNLTVTWTDSTAETRALTTRGDGSVTMNYNARNYEGRQEGLVTFEVSINGTDLGATASINVTIEPQRGLIINATPAVLSADGTSKSVISVQVRNGRNNPMVGDTIRFMSTAGLITASSVTDKDGKATAELTSDRRNVTANIIATLIGGDGASDSIAVEFRGVSITATASPRSTKTGDGDSSVITAYLVDAGNNPIVGEPVTFTRSLAGTLIAEAGRAVQNDSTITVNTNPSGEARITIKRPAGSTETAERISVKGAGAYGTTDYIQFSDKLLTITPAAGNRYRVYVDASDTSAFSIKYTDGAGDSIPNAPIEFAVTLGTIINPPDIHANGHDQFFTTPDTIFTDANGRATFTMNNPTFTTIGTLWVRAEHTIIATYPLDFRPAGLGRIVLEATPFVIGVGGSKAKLIATAYDINGNRAKGLDIAFNILQGPGGGEHLDPKTVERTGDDGTAVTYLVPGSILSQWQGVHIQASHHDYIYSNVIKLTIAGPAEHIRVSWNTEKIEAENAVYKLELTTLVSDINQNPIPDGTEVTYSATVIGYRYYALSARFEENQSTNVRQVLIDTIPVDISSEWYYKFEPNIRAYRPYPRFNDINKNGIPDRGRDVEPCDWQTPEAFKDSIDCGGNLFADFNGNGKRDTIEAFHEPDSADYGPHYRFNASGSGATLSAIGAPYYDIDWNWNSVAEPSTAVLLERTILSDGGRADNILTYAQSDAWRVRVRIVAECQGKVSNPTEFILPLSTSARNWFYFD